MGAQAEPETQAELPESGDDMRPLIATPCYGDVLCVNYVRSITSLYPVPDIIFMSGSLITYIRNELTARFLAGPWSHLFFIDADIGFPPTAFRRLLCSGRDVVATAAAFKNDAAETQGGFTVDITEMGQVDDNGFASINSVGTGFMCIERGAFERMTEAGIGKNEFFDTMRIGDEYLADDHAFCHRWRGIGGEIYLDTLSNLTHQGTKVYSRDFHSYLAEGSKEK